MLSILFTVQLLLLLSFTTEVTAFTVLSNSQQSSIRPFVGKSLYSTADDASPETPPFCIPTTQTIASSLESLRSSSKPIVIKYGGNAMTSPTLFASFCQDIATLQSLGLKIVVVHGGGPQISSMLKRCNVQSEFASNGMRISSEEVVEIAEMVLCGSVNKDVSAGISNAGGRAIGISGRDSQLLQCTKLVGEDGLDVGLVGKVDHVNTSFLEGLLEMGLVPVVAPIGTGYNGDEGIAYNCNADVAAGRIAGELKADRVLFLTDIAGVCDPQQNMELIPALDIAGVEGLIADGTITGGMIPKVSYAVDAVKLGVKGAFITDGRVPHAVLREVLGGGSDGMGSGEGGTVITA